ncbi:MAG: Gfo/Idh/MocA family oxidoreductase, partial [Tannerella sp.]|nr:Gfo/Idh/MocA family oxidoreductase [Tannerella sp.]
MNNIKFAVVGCGHIGKRHAEMIVREEGAELAALCDIQSPQDVGVQHLNVPFFNSLDDLLNSGIDFDVLNVCTPNGLHAEMAVKAIQSNHHTVIEKPMALTVSDAEKVIFTS